MILQCASKCASQWMWFEYVFLLKSENISNLSLTITEMYFAFLNGRLCWHGLQKGFFVVLIHMSHAYRTDSINLNRQGHNIRMYWTNFWPPTVHIQKNIFENTLIEVCSSYIYASCDTFCVQIGQLFEARWAFKNSEEFRNQRHFLR